MIDIKNILPECNADTMLVELILQRGKPPHYHGINNVGKELVTRNTGRVVIGVVDTDRFKRPDPNISRFTEVVEDKLATEGLLFLKLPATTKHLIRIDPDFEPWIWKLAQDNDLAGTYGFNKLNDVIEAAKTLKVMENANFKKFVNSIVTANPTAIQTLRTWLSMAV